MKPRPTMIYREEQRCDTCSYHNSTTQHLNEPKGWPGPSVREVERMLNPSQGPHSVTIRTLEGIITWQEEISV